MPRIITGASKRGEPLREGRLWRSRRSGRRGRVRGVGSTLAAAPGCPALTTWVRHAEALSAAAHPASRTTKRLTALRYKEMSHATNAWLEMDRGLVEALLHVQRLHRLAKRVHRFLMLAGLVECFSVGALFLHFVQLRR
jgi:hypothetical protein